MGCGRCTVLVAAGLALRGSGRSSLLVGAPACRDAAGGGVGRRRRHAAGFEAGQSCPGQLPGHQQYYENFGFCRVRVRVRWGLFTSGARGGILGTASFQVCR